MGSNKLHKMLLNEQPVELILEAIKKNPSLVNAIDDGTGCTPLMIAIAREYPVEVIEALLAAGADMKRMSSHHENVVSVVVNSIMDSIHNRRVFVPRVPDLSSLRFVIEKGAEIPKKDFPTVLYLFASSDEYDFFDTLIERAPNVNFHEESHGYTPLMFAICLGRLEAVDKLIAMGADVNARDEFGHNALFFAMNGCFSGCHSWGISHLDKECKPKLLASLMEKGAKFDVVTEEGNNLLMVAAAMLNLECVQLFLSKGLDVNAKKQERSHCFVRGS